MLFFFWVRRFVRLFFVWRRVVSQPSTLYMTWYVILLYSAVRRIYVPGMYSCIQSAAAAAAAAAVAAAAVCCYTVVAAAAAAASCCCSSPCAGWQICCWFIASDSTVLFLFFQRRFSFNLPLDSTVAFTASIFLHPR